MNLRYIDVNKCEREEKEVIEGICLSYDMIRNVCMETMRECDAIAENDQETGV